MPKDYDAEDNDEELTTDEGRRYRQLAATVNYLALDRPDLQFAASVSGRTMARPTQNKRSDGLSDTLIPTGQVARPVGEAPAEDF